MDLIKLMGFIFVISMLAGCKVTVGNSGGGVVTSDDGKLNCGDVCEADYSRGDGPIVLTATPFNGYQFAGWSGVCNHKESQCYIKSDDLSSNSSLAASFQLDSLEISKILTSAEYIQAGAFEELDLRVKVKASTNDFNISKVFAIVGEENEVYLRDDGVNGDFFASDNMYFTRLSIDASSLAPGDVIPISVVVQTPSGNSTSKSINLNIIKYPLNSMLERNNSVDGSGGYTYSADYLTVALEENADLSIFDSILDNVGATVKRWYEIGDYYLIELNYPAENEVELESYIERLMSESIIVEVRKTGFATEHDESSGLIEIPFIPNGRESPSEHTDTLWHLDKIRASESWKYVKGKELIAVIDSGIDADHPDLKGKISKGVYYTQSEEGLDDLRGHGTSVAGLIAARPNNGSIVGVSQNSKIIDYRVSSKDKDARVPDIIKAITDAKNTGARIINISLGCNNPNCEKIFCEVTDSVTSSGVIIVASSGNFEPKKMYPAECPSVISVTATNKQDELAYFVENSHLIKAIAAPGVGIWTDENGGGIVSKSGTSFSAPIVTGAISVLLEREPDLTSKDIFERFYSTGALVTNPNTTDPSNFRRIDLYSAIGNFKRIDSVDYADENFRKCAISAGVIGGYIFASELRHLNCFGFDLQSIEDLKKFKNLESFDAQSHILRDVQTPSSSVLRHVRLIGDDIANVNMLDSENLTSLTITKTSPGEINISVNPSLQSIKISGSHEYSTNINLEDLVNLKSIDIRDVTLQENIDLSSNADLTYIVIDNSNVKSINLPSSSNIEYLSLRENDISEFYTAYLKSLKYFQIGGNSLSSLDLSPLTLLETLEVSYNNISSLDFSGLDNLRYFSASQNNLTTLNFESNPALSHLSVAYNNLTSIKFSPSVNLNYISASSNQISDIDLSTSIDLAQVQLSNNKLRNIDLPEESPLAYLRISNNELSSLKLDGFNSLVHLDIVNNPIDELTINSPDTLRSAIISSETLRSLDLSHHTSLISLTIGESTQLSSLNIMGNDNLEDLRLYGTALKSLNIEASSKLRYISILKSSLETIIFPNDMPEIETIYLDGNKLTEFQIGSSLSLRTLSLNNNLLSTFSMGTNPSLISLSLSGNNLDSLAVGPQSALRYFDISNNRIANLDVSEAYNIEYLNMRYNDIASIDLSMNTNLDRLYATGNQLALLDLSNNGSLRTLNAELNNLSVFKIANPSALEKIHLFDNEIESFDLEGLVSIDTLTIRFNPLTYEMMDRLEMLKDINTSISYCTSYRPGEGEAPPDKQYPYC